jgi:hypothetical protein
MTTQKQEKGLPASGRQSMTPEKAKEKGLDPTPFGKPKGK